MNDEARVDKWLWAARIFKTRSIAAAACKKGQVTLGGRQLKPSHTVRVGDTVDVKKPPITYSFKILQAIEHRVGAKLIPEVLENVTRAEQYELLEMRYKTRRKDFKHIAMMIDVAHSIACHTPIYKFLCP